MTLEVQSEAIGTTSATLLGGKGANLGEMSRIGVPVPPGFTITAETCQAYIGANGEFPAGMWDQVVEALQSHGAHDRKSVRRLRRTRSWSPAARAQNSRCPG